MRRRCPVRFAPLAGVWLCALTSAPLAQASCPTAQSAADVARALEQADTAFQAADPVAFRAADDLAVATTACLDSLIQPALAASLHRASGVRAFLDRHLEDAQVQFAAARRLDDGFSWPVALIPANHPLRRAYVATDPAGITTTSAPVPRTGSLAFDGHIGQDRPDGVPTLYQRLDRAGAPVTTILLSADDPLPHYPRLGALPVAVRPAHVVTAAGLLATTVLYSAALATRGKYNNLDTAYPQLDALRGRITGLSVAAGVTFAVTLGAGGLVVQEATAR